MPDFTTTSLDQNWSAIAVYEDVTGGGSGTVINATTDALTLTTYQAALIIDTTINASVDNLTLTTYPATIQTNTDTTINAGTESLTLTTYQATIQAGSNIVINANTDNLSLTTYPASIQADKVIQMGTQVLTLTAYPCVISLDSSTTINANHDALTLIAYPFIITDTPTAIDDSYTIIKDAGATGLPVAANDKSPTGRPLDVTSIDDTGTVGQALLALGQVTYSPNGQFDSLDFGETALDSFTYTIENMDGATDTATISITVNGGEPLEAGYHEPVYGHMRIDLAYCEGQQAQLEGLSRIAPNNHYEKALQAWYLGYDDAALGDLKEFCGLYF